MTRRPGTARGCLVLLAFASLAPARSARAGDTAAPSAPPANYAAVFLGTSLGYQPHGGSWHGWQHDLTSLVGYGRQLRPTLAVEIDAGPTYVRGSYSSFSLTPGLVWSATSHVYLAARFIVPVDPEANLVLYPGVGVCRPSGRWLPTLELNLSSAVGRGKPDLGVTLTAGLSYFF